MDWDIELARQPEKFLARHHLPQAVIIELVLRAVQKLCGEPIAVDLKPLTGKWSGRFRIRTSKYRIIFSVNFGAHSVYVEVFDNRDSAYR